MYFLNILDSPTLHLIAEIGAIVIGSVLMGIFFAYLHWGGFKRRSIELNNKLDFEKNKVFEVNTELEQLTSIRNHLADEIVKERNKSNAQAKTIFDQQQRLFDFEKKLRDEKTTIDRLNDSIEQYERRLKTIEDQFSHQNNFSESVFDSPASKPLRANYDHISRILGKQITENDLTIITGIGPRTASLLQAMGIDTWELLAQKDVDELKASLEKAGGNYKSLDPTHWPKQASMAAQSEWRKLRVYQETLRTLE